MGNCAACADQAGGTENKLQELPDSIGFTQLTQMHYIANATSTASAPNKSANPTPQRSINLRFRIVTKSVFPELFDESLKQEKEIMQKTGLLSEKEVQTRNIMYKVSYGTQVQIWEEEVKTSAEPFNHSQIKVLEYDFLEGEIIRVEVAMAEDKAKLKEKPYFDGYAEFNINHLIRSSKDKSLKLKPILPIEQEGVESELKENPSNEEKQESLGFITIDLRQHRRDQVQRVRLSLEGFDFQKSKNLLCFTLYEQLGQNRIQIYESPLVQRIQQFFSFNGVEFKSDRFTTSPIENVNIVLAVREEKEPSVFRELGEVQFVLGKFLENQSQILPVMNEAGKVIGKIRVKDFSLKPFHSFLDYMATGLQIVPIIGIDFSLTNITFDEKTVLHSLSGREFKAGIGPQNPYITLLRAISRVHSGISSYAIPIGFGAKTVPGESQTSDCFAVNFNLFEPTVPLISQHKQNPTIPPHEELEKCYSEALKKIQLSAPVHYRQMLSLSCDFAEYAMYEKQDKQRDVPRNFYVLYLLTVGLVDDYEESIKELVRGIELPLVIVIVKMGKQDLQDMKDVEDVVMRCGSHYSENERKYIEIIDFESLVKNTHKESVFTDSGSFAAYTRTRAQTNQFTNASTNALENSFLEERTRSGTVSRITQRLLSEKDEEDAISKQITLNLAHQIEEYMNGREIYPTNASKDVKAGEQSEPISEVWNHIEEEFWVKVNEVIGSEATNEARQATNGLPEANLEVLKLLLAKNQGINLNIDQRKQSTQSSGKFSLFSEEEEVKTGIPKTDSQLRMDEQIRQLSVDFQNVDYIHELKSQEYSAEVSDYVTEIVRIASENDLDTLKKLNSVELSQLKASS